MSSVSWYWHRLRAMTAAELAAHGRRKYCQVADRFMSGRRFAHVEAMPAGSTFPNIPPSETAPEELRAALRSELRDLLEGRWIAFGYLKLQVEDPPGWHKDYLAGVDMTTRKPALKLHHRLEGKADIKLIWEPNRWYSLVRLAQAAYLLDDHQAAGACLKWLEDWVEKNPPYFGWNWTSGLETGLRLIQFAWIDALLTSLEIRGVARGARAIPRTSATLARLRPRILLPHAWFTWRDRSFGSSANNHVLGELAGLILAVVRWPELSRWCGSLERLERLWEREVLAQFAPDGGNREQALNYHLFGWEFCWQARLALRASGRSIAPAVEDRLRMAAAFFVGVQTKEQMWDYGDSDSAYVTPLFRDWLRATPEWHRWLEQPASSPAIRYWLGDSPKPMASPAVAVVANNWRIYSESGIAIYRDRDWFLRWDLSPLGYLATAGHGHCDALHLSLWHRGRAVLVDPGTGAYHANRPLRDYLASWRAHNGPHFAPDSFPERRGAFLWGGQHEKPSWRQLSETSLQGTLRLPAGVVSRTITRLPKEDGWQIEDAFQSAAPVNPASIQVLWQFAPTIELRSHAASAKAFDLGPTPLTLAVGASWTEMRIWSPAKGDTAPPAGQFEGICSDAFRRTHLAPCLLVSSAAGRGPWQTTIQAG